MSFLSKVEAAENTIPLAEVYRGDPQYHKLVDSVAELIRRLASKFMIDEKTLTDFFIEHLKEELL